MLTLHQVSEARVRAGTGQQVVAIARDLGADYGPLLLAVRGVTFKTLTDPAPVITPPGSVPISDERAAAIVELSGEGFGLNELSWLTGLGSTTVRRLCREHAANRAEPAVAHADSAYARAGEGGGRAEAAKWTAVLCAARVAEGYPKRQFAQVLGVTEATVDGWHARRRVPTLPVMVTAGRELGLRLAIHGAGRAGNSHAQGAVTAPDGTWEQLEIRHLEERLRGKRHRGGITQQDLAPAVGVSVWSLSQIEQGGFHPRPAVLAAWAAALDCRVRWRTMT